MVPGGSFILIGANEGRGSTNVQLIGRCLGANPRNVCCVSDLLRDSEVP